MGTASLFGIQANFCLDVIWKHKSKHVKEEEDKKAMKADTTKPTS